MNKELLFNLFSLLLFVVIIFATLLGFISIENSLSILVLLITAWVIGKQSFATEQMAENQIRPAVDVRLIFYEDDDSSGTAFQFINVSEVPTYVWLDIQPTVNGNKLSQGEKEELLSEYLIGQKKIEIGIRKYITSNQFLKNLIDNYEDEDIRISVKIDVAPFFNPDSRSNFHEKKYKFDFEDREWKHIPFWNIPDPVYRGFKELKEKVDERREED